MTAHTYHKDATPLYWAVRLNLFPVVKHTVASIANINRPDGFVGTALHVAAFNNNLQLAEQLIDHDANVNIIVGHFGNPLEAAVFANQEQMVALLLRMGATVNGQDRKSSSALAKAEDTGHGSIVKLLRTLVLSSAFRVKASTDIEKTFCDAILKGELQGVQEAIRNGVDVNLPIKSHS